MDFNQEMNCSKLYNNIPLGILYVDKKGNILMLNNKAEEIYGVINNGENKNILKTAISKKLNKVI